MKDFLYIFVILLLFVLILFVAYSDWGDGGRNGIVVEDASAKDRFSTKRFPETSGSGLKSLLPQELPAFEGLPQRAIDPGQKNYQRQQKFVKERTLEQQKRSDERARKENRVP
ncbi:MAG: hypothetical protein ABFQ95_02055 [Pseudomonadota bacterium]